MSTENDGLFDGFQIMTPAELNAAVEAKETTEGGEPTGVSNEFTITPVKAEEGRDKDDTKEVTTTTTTDDNKTSGSNENAGEVKYKALMKELVTAGVITAAQLEELEELPGTFDSIKDLISKTVDQKTTEKEENWKKSMTGAKKRFLEVEDAFDDTDTAIQMAQRLEFLEGLTPDTIKADVNLQKQLYYNQLLAKGFSNEDAMEQLADAEAINKLEEKALKAHPDLKNSTHKVVEESRAAKETRTQEEIKKQEEAFKSLLDNVDSREYFIEGLQLNKVAKDKIKNNIITPVHKDENGREYNSLMYKQMKNKTEFEMLINYYDSIGLFNIDSKGNFKPDISKLKNVAKTQAVNELDKVIAAEEQRGVGRNTSVETSEKTNSILSMLEKVIK
jgi:hypothetical protein